MTKNDWAVFATTKAYFNADGSPKAAGTLLKNPEYAATLNAISKDGAKAFYQGEISADIINTVQTAKSNPGCIGTKRLRHLLNQTTWTGFVQLMKSYYYLWHGTTKFRRINSWTDLSDDRAVWPQIMGTKRCEILASVSGRFLRLAFADRGYVHGRPRLRANANPRVSEYWSFAGTSPVNYRR